MDLKAVIFAALAGLRAVSAAPACTSLELIGPGAPRSGAPREIPVYLAIPDSLGPFPVRPFLLSPPDSAKVLLARAESGFQTMDKTERRMLRALRIWLDGDARGAGEEIAALLQKSPPSLRPILKADKALLLYMAGFGPDAEKEWLAQSGSGAACKEAARKNLFSYYLDRRELEKARAALDRILGAEPKDKWANDARAYLVRLAASDEEWEAFLKSKSEGRDSLFDIQIAYADLLKSQGRYEEAKRYYNRGLEGAPRNGPAWLELAEVYDRLEMPLLAWEALDNCFAAGISDPKVFEVLGRVLIRASAYASQRRPLREREWGALDMRDLRWTLGPEWAERCWRLAEANLEVGLPKDFHRRTLAQLLYHVYCHNGKVEAARALRGSFWFHFTGPAVVPKLRLHGERRDPDAPCLAAAKGGCKLGGRADLDVNLGYVSFPLANAAARGDFFFD
jgi:tetratricopeptide (TPR) repeat protein